MHEGEESVFFKDLSSPIVQDDLMERLMSFNKVFITPHHSIFTKEAVEQIGITTIPNGVSSLKKSKNYI